MNGQGGVSAAPTAVKEAIFEKSWPLPGPVEGSKLCMPAVKPALISQVFRGAKGRQSGGTFPDSGEKWFGFADSGQYRHPGPPVQFKAQPVPGNSPGSRQKTTKTPSNLPRHTDPSARMVKNEIISI